MLLDSVVFAGAVKVLRPVTNDAGLVRVATAVPASVAESPVISFTVGLFALPAAFTSMLVRL
ncbi:MAG: hypothetical protein F4X98_06165 [Gammaproteobacteria bacterium]|nr:hypothetical protein [Gammaproteobacteria bacterium]